ncbi:DUF7563 family protein [Natronorubrum sp. FCH18a]|uniref:DUF7563 family protein n=1 Tax=Natronorubrum sp. FCH18a TaxID=3447018 RepID=UPI003F50D9A1
MHSCNTCGSDLSRAYTRVFGDNDGSVRACLYCAEPARQRERLSSDRGARTAPFTLEQRV